MTTPQEKECTICKGRRTLLDNDLIEIPCDCVTPPTEDWEEQLENLNHLGSMQILKGFISQLITSTKEEVRKDMISKIPTEWKDELDEEEKELIEKILGREYTTPEHIKERMYGYNMCRKEIFQALSDTKE